MRVEQFQVPRKPDQEWRRSRDRLIAFMRTFTPDEWERPLGTFAQLPNFSAADLRAFAEHHAAGTLRAFLNEKYSKFSYGFHVIAAIERFYGREDE